MENSIMSSIVRSYTGGTMDQEITISNYQLCYLLYMILNDANLFIFILSSSKVGK